MSRGGRLALLYFFVSGVTLASMHVSFIVRLVLLYALFVCTLVMREKIWCMVCACIGYFRGALLYTVWPITPHFLLVLRNMLEQDIALWFPSPTSSFVQGLLLGSNGSLNFDFLEALRITGLSHVVALSGYNISVLLQSSKFFTSSIWWSMSLVSVFIIFTGASTSVVRAGLMGFIMLMYRRLGRVGDIWWAIILSASVMALFNPRVVLFDLGFELSFLATIGVIYGSQLKIFSRLPEVLRTTLGATLLTSPLLVAKFGRFSVVSPLANLLVVPLVPYLMLISTIAVSLSFISNMVGILIRYPVIAAFDVVIRLVFLLSHIPYASLQ